MSSTQSIATVNQTEHPLDPFTAHLASLIIVGQETKDLLASCKTYEEYADVIADHIHCFSMHSKDAFFKFYGLHNFVPAGVYVRYALDQVYTTYRIEKGMFFETLGAAIAKETPEEKADREAIVRENLKDYIKPNGKVTLYRGTTSINYKSTTAISYTVNKEKAEWFMKRNQLFGGKDGIVIAKDFPLNKILWYTNCRNEQEVLVISPYLLRFINYTARCMRNHF